jgi:beta-lactamase superfamily II metal-dependent hydrolase
MTLIVFPDNSIYMYDCNLTEENSEKVLSYLHSIIGKHGIDVFINSHRDADHMRGIADLHAEHPITEIWDSGVPGTATDSPEYRAFMRLRNSLPSIEVRARRYWTRGEAKLRCMNSRWEDFSDPNEQSLVFKVEYRKRSVILAGDTNYRPWKEKILPYYRDEDLQSSILLAAHHGSLAFFEDPSNQRRYTDHVRKIRPDMTIVSVGPNVNDLPNAEAISLYTEYSQGSNRGTTVLTTEEKGTMKLTLKDEGGWHLDMSK